MKVLVSALVGSLCGCVDVDDGLDQLEESEQAVTTPVTTISTCASGACNNITIATNASVCVLSEIDGDLAHGGSVRIHKGFAGAWFLDISSPANNNLRVRTSCITLRAGSTHTLVTWQSSSQTNPIFHGGVSSRCFLSEVTAHDTSAFLAFDTNFFIAPGPGTFDQRILGVFPSGAHVTIAMECFAAPSLIASVAYGNGGAAQVGGVLAPLASDVVCGLTGLGGIFATPSVGDGVRLRPLGSDFVWEASGWKGIHGQCVR